METSLFTVIRTDVWHGGYHKRALIYKGDEYFTFAMYQDCQTDAEIIKEALINHEIQFV
jgi:hypothetical protein